MLPNVARVFASAPRAVRLGALPGSSGATTLTFGFPSSLRAPHCYDAASVVRRWTTADSARVTSGSYLAAQRVVRLSTFLQPWRCAFPSASAATARMSLAAIAPIFASSSNGQPASCNPRLNSTSTVGPRQPHGGRGPLRNELGAWCGEVAASRGGARTVARRGTEFAIAAGAGFAARWSGERPGNLCPSERGNACDFAAPRDSAGGRPRVRHGLFHRGCAGRALPGARAV